MEKHRRYYFGTDALMLLDECGLAGKQGRFKRRAGSELLITATV